MNDAGECKDQVDLSEEECVKQPSSNLSSTVPGRGERTPGCESSDSWCFFPEQTFTGTFRHGGNSMKPRGEHRRLLLISGKTSQTRWKRSALSCLHRRNRRHSYSSQPRPLLWGRRLNSICLSVRTLTEDMFRPDGNSNNTCFSEDFDLPSRLTRRLRQV